MIDINFVFDLIDSLYILDHSVGVRTVLCLDVLTHRLSRKKKMFLIVRNDMISHRAYIPKTQKDNKSIRTYGPQTEESDSAEMHVPIQKNERTRKTN